jgi:hypothetical protein
MSAKEKPIIPPKLIPCSWLKPQRWFHYDDEQPYLVLYTFSDRQAPPLDKSRPMSRPPRPAFVDPSSWVDLFHQTAGFACHHLNIHARFLKPRKKILPLLEELSANYLESLLSPPVSFDDAQEYQNILARYGLSANRDYIYLQEGFYPIDIEFIKKVTAEEFPADLQDLIVKKKHPRNRWSFLERRTFGLAVLGPNCD